MLEVMECYLLNDKNKTREWTLNDMYVLNK